MALDPELQKLLADMGLNVNGNGSVADRPEVPPTMLGLHCAAEHEVILAVGDAYNETGYNEQGVMTLALTSPTRQIGAIVITSKQVRQLRDFLNTKLDQK